MQLIVCRQHPERSEQDLCRWRSKIEVREKSAGVTPYVRMLLQRYTWVREELNIQVKHIKPLVSNMVR